MSFLSWLFRSHSREKTKPAFVDFPVILKQQREVSKGHLIISQAIASRENIGCQVHYTGIVEQACEDGEQSLALWLRNPTEPTVLAYGERTPESVKAAIRSFREKVPVRLTGIVRSINKHRIELGNIRLDSIA